MAEEAQLSDDEKKERLRALNYERGMLRATAMALASGIIENRLTQNTFVESFLIHARLLIAFLYGPYQKDDFRPGDWLDPDEWKEICGAKSELLENTHKDAHKYLCHLTATRLNQKRTWDCPGILREIEAVLDKFFQRVELLSSERDK